MSKILYLGGFEMPDKNAAAQRVLSIAKSFREIGYDTFFYGIAKSDVSSGIVDGFRYSSYPYPSNIKSWLKYALGKDIIRYIESVDPDIIFLYNYPAVAQEKIIRYCRKHGIKTIGDITEWYGSKSLPKIIDTWFRMRVSNKHLDGIISISTYLSNYYRNQHIVQIPPLVDKTETKWQLDENGYPDDKIHLVYIGTGSIKDRLDKIIKGIADSSQDRFVLDIIGINEEKFYEIYDSNVDIKSINVTFHGRLLHSEALKYLKKSDFQIFFRDNIRVNNAGFPTKFVESMSAGVPVITNNISNIADYIIDGVNSFMIESSSEREICQVLKRVSTLSRDDINEIKTRCLVNDFDYNHFVDKIRSFLEGIDVMRKYHSNRWC